MKDHFELKRAQICVYFVLGMEGIIYMMVPICITQNNYTWISLALCDCNVVLTKYVIKLLMVIRY